MLRRASFHAEKVFRARGSLRSMLWLTETQDGRQQMFECECMAERDEASDDEVLNMLCAELRADFADDHVTAYAVAYAATATTALRKSILHLDCEEYERAVVAIEAHDGDHHLRCHREIIGGHLGALSPIGPAPLERFGLLLGGTQHA
jgi:hypothetical protein